MNEPTRGDRPVHHDFRLQERDGAIGPEQSAATGEAPFAAARDALRSAWAPPRDTFVTEDLPVLLTRLNLVQTGGDKARAAEVPDEG